ncbi:ssDNA exonuclease RecJ1 [Methanobrevibacter ruminantium M1]|uniref:SsDNA exonuclease RecJ1 n=1 Tax=Methanobrevibacter ruminantium (strain ATCC 35063 / DSM 1093 / JCM 13430 / OCM 146 / M1) TaxID=634498 RepID=D3E0X3_METRM|nr:DHH family phosphoesterase [Methanobrevibacter ruminantium]ADC47947.1 ssDNA exonuclease RecJ1 [Methanobrevibacter ruminantium M1]
MLKKHIENEDIIRLISHNDADGLSAAGVIANAIKEEGGQFHITIVPRLKPDVIRDVSKEKYELYVFSDMGSACIKQLNRLKSDVIVADHHQPSEHEPKDNLIHVNPHLFGIDGSRHLSGAGSSYLVVRNMNKKHLAYMALIGAFGDMQCANRFTGINQLILKDGQEAGNLELHEDLKIVSKAQEPLYKSIAYTLNPALPGLTGRLDNSQELLEKMGVSYGISFLDLEDEEKDVVKDELVKVNPQIFGDVYSVPSEHPVLRDLEEYSSILDACGKNKEYGLALSIILGEREKSLDEALKLQKRYREDLTKGFEWISREGAQQLGSIQYLYSEDKVLKSIMGTIAGVGMSAKILSDEKPVIGLSRLHNDIKVSGRATRFLVARGVNLGKALADASVNFGGQGGGHDIAAGAMIPYEAKDNFLHLLDQIVEDQLQ